MKSRNYPIPRTECGAKTRKGGACRQPAMKNGRCRLHGGKSKKGKEHGRYKHGLCTTEVLNDRREISELIKSVRKILDQIQNP